MHGALSASSIVWSSRSLATVDQLVELSARNWIAISTDSCWIVGFTTSFGLSRGFSRPTPFVLRSVESLIPWIWPSIAGPKLVWWRQKSLPHGLVREWVARPWCYMGTPASQHWAITHWVPTAAGLVRWYQLGFPFCCNSAIWTCPKWYCLFRQTMPPRRPKTTLWFVTFVRWSGMAAWEEHKCASSQAAIRMKMWIKCLLRSAIGWGATRNYFVQRTLFRHLKRFSKFQNTGAMSRLQGWF